MNTTPTPSAKKKIATYAVAATAVLSGGVGTLLAVFADGAQAADDTTATTAAAPGDRGPRGPRDGVARTDHLADAAGALGLTADALRTELQAGKSLTQVAQEKGVDLQKVKDALAASHTKALDEAVAAGKITQAQADQRKAGLAAHIDEAVTRTGPGPGKGGGPHKGAGRVDHLAVAATALGMDAAVLRTELVAGKSLAQVAAAKGVDVQKVKDALIAAHSKALDEAVAAGKITQAEADQRKAGLADHVTKAVDRVGMPDKGGHGHGRPSTSATPSTTTTD